MLDLVPRRNIGGLQVPILLEDYVVRLLEGLGAEHVGNDYVPAATARSWSRLLRAALCADRVSERRPSGAPGLARLLPLLDGHPVRAGGRSMSHTLELLELEPLRVEDGPLEGVPPWISRVSSMSAWLLAAIIRDPVYLTAPCYH